MNYHPDHEARALDALAADIATLPAPRRQEQEAAFGRLYDAIGELGWLAVQAQAPGARAAIRAAYEAARDYSRAVAEGGAR